MPQAAGGRLRFTHECADAAEAASNVTADATAKTTATRRSLMLLPFLSIVPTAMLAERGRPVNGWRARHHVRAAPSSA